MELHRFFIFLYFYFPKKLVQLQGMRIPSYDDELLRLAEDLARRMLPAFDTPTGIITGLLYSGDILLEVVRIYLHVEVNLTTKLLCICYWKFLIKCLTFQKCNFDTSYCSFQSRSRFRMQFKQT